MAGMANNKTALKQLAEISDSTIKAVEQGSISLRSAGQVVSLALDKNELLLENGSTMIAADLAHELAGGCFESHEEAVALWEELRDLLQGLTSSELP